MNRKILVIVNEQNYNTEAVKDSRVDIAYTYYRSNCTFMRLIYRLWGKYNIPFFYIWFKFRNIDIKEYDLIIIFECQYIDKIIKYIRNKNKKIRIIYWLWNTVDKSMKSILYSAKEQTFNLLKKKNNELYRCEIWSFDKNDCKKYNFKYNNQVAWKINLANRIVKYDFFFCGKDKGRFKYLKALKDKYIKYKYKFYILPDKAKIYENDDRKYFLSSPIPYTDLIKYMNECRCIIDIVQDGQGGITWRPLEAMFYKKKLLTNYKDIVSYDFYNKNNIFILGVDDLDRLDDFLNSTYEEIPEKIVIKYTAKGWLDNFINYYKNR